MIKKKKNGAKLQSAFDGSGKQTSCVRAEVQTLFFWFVGFSQISQGPIFCQRSVNDSLVPVLAKLQLRTFFQDNGASHSSVTAESSLERL